MEVFFWFIFSAMNVLCLPCENNLRDRYPKLVGVYHIVHIELTGSPDFYEKYIDEPIILFKNSSCNSSNDMMTILRFKDLKGDIYEFEAYISNSHYLIMFGFNELEFYGEYVSSKTGKKEAIYLKDRQIDFKDKLVSLKENPFCYFDYIKCSTRRLFKKSGGTFYNIDKAAVNSPIHNNYLKLANSLPDLKEKKKLKEVLRKERKFFDNKESECESEEIQNYELKERLCHLINIPFKRSLLSIIFKEMKSIFFPRETNKIEQIFNAYFNITNELIRTRKDRWSLADYEPYSQVYNKIENAILVIFITQFNIVDSNAFDSKALESNLLELNSRILELNFLFKDNNKNNLIQISQKFIKDLIAAEEKINKFKKIDIKKRLKLSEEDILYTQDDEFIEMLKEVKSVTENDLYLISLILIKKYLQTIFMFSFFSNCEKIQNYESTIPELDTCSTTDLTAIIRSLLSIKSALGIPHESFSEISIINKPHEVQTWKFGLFYRLNRSIGSYLEDEESIDRIVMLDRNNEEVNADYLIFFLEDYFVIFMSHESYIKYRYSNLQLRIYFRSDDEQKYITFKGVTRINKF